MKKSRAREKGKGVGNYDSTLYCDYFTVSTNSLLVLYYYIDMTCMLLLQLIKNVVYCL
jgi:hypothetical protein